jgi:hypothetical protein
MATRSRNGIATDGRSILLDLQSKQKLFKRDSGEWLKIQRRIDKIVAKNYLQYHIGESHV